MKHVLNREDGPKWHLVFMLLSLDCANPFFQEMGLVLLQKSLLHKHARKFVKEYRVIENNSLHDDHTSLKYKRKLFQDTFESLEKEFGENYCMEIYNWGKYSFQYNLEKTGDAFVWLRLFHQLIGLGNSRYPVVDLLINSQTKDFVIKSAKKYFKSPVELENRIQKAEGGPLSEWDQLIFSTYSLGASPLDWVKENINYLAFRRFWEEITGMLTKQDLSNLLSWGRKQAVAFNMPQSLVNLPEFIT